MRLVPAPVLFAGLCLTLATSLVAQSSASASLRPLVSFKNSRPGFYQGSWTSDTVQRTKQGMFVAGDATGAGKVGESGFTWDLSQDKFVELAIAVGPSNRVLGVGLVLVDTDGTELRWALPLADMEPGRPKPMRLEFSHAIATTVTGETPGFDRTKVTMWRIEGDGVPSTSAQLVLIHLQAGR